MITLTSLLWLFLFLTGYVHHSVYGDATTRIECTEGGVLGQPLNITCTITTGPIVSGINYNRPDAIQVSTCDTGHACLPNPGYSVPVASASLYILQISSFGAVDIGDWQCIDGSGGFTRGSVPALGGCDIAQSGTTYTVDLTQYACSDAVSFQLRSDQGPSCNLSLADSTTNTGLRNNTGTCTSTLTGTVSPAMLCGNCEYTLPCNINPVCTCQCKCECKAGAPAAVAIAVITVLLGIGLIVFVLMSEKVNGTKKTVLIVLAGVFICLALISLIVAAVVSQSQDKTQVAGEDCCCSTCETNGESEKKLCSDLGIAGIVLSLLAMIPAIAVIIKLCCCGGRNGSCCSPQSGQQEPGKMNKNTADKDARRQRPRDGNAPVDKHEDMMSTNSTPPLHTSHTAIIQSFRSSSPRTLPPRPQRHTDENAPADKQENLATNRTTDSSDSEKLTALRSFPPRTLPQITNSEEQKVPKKGKKKKRSRKKTKAELTENTGIGSQENLQMPDVDSEEH